MQTTTYSLHIPKPCHQGWQNMQPSEGGRYCSQCSKTVVDFTQMSDEAIQQYFIQRQGQGVCGYFKTAQLQRVRITLPGYVLQKRLRAWQKFLVVLLLCFGSNFMGIDVLWGGDGNALYAQTVIKSKGFAKAKKSKAKRKRGKQVKNKYYIESFGPDIFTHALGYIIPKPEPTYVFPHLDICQTTVDDSIRNPILAVQTNNNPDKETPPQNIPPQQKAYLLPLVGRRRRKELIS